jgi:hypothetical protein
VLVVLSRLPRVLPFLVIFGLLLAGLVLENVAGGVLLLALAVLLGWLLYLAWPVLQPPRRFVRLAVVLLVVASAVPRFG